MTTRLREGNTAASAVQVIAVHLTGLKNVINSATGGSAYENAMMAIDLYIKWAANAESVFRHIFEDHEIADGLYSERYWRLQEMTTTARLPWVILLSEIEFQERRLAEISTGLELQIRLANQRGAPIFLDTNFFLHFKQVQDITPDQWRQITTSKAAEFRLIVHAQVVRELDTKQHGAPKSKVPERAKRTAKFLDKKLPEAIKPEGAEVRDGVRLYILLDESDHQRQASGDVEIINGILQYARATDTAPVVVTNDVIMRADCAVRGIRAVIPAEEFRE